MYLFRLTYSVDADDMDLSDAQIEIFIIAESIIDALEVFADARRVQDPDFPIWVSGIQLLSTGILCKRVKVIVHNEGWLVKDAN